MRSTRKDKIQKKLKGQKKKKKTTKTNASVGLVWNFLEEVKEENTNTLNYAQVVTWVFGPTFSSDGVAR